MRTGRAGMKPLFFIVGAAFILIFLLALILFGRPAQRGDELLEEARIRERPCREKSE